MEVFELCKELSEEKHHDEWMYNMNRMETAYDKAWKLTKQVLPDACLIVTSDSEALVWWRFLTILGCLGGSASGRFAVLRRHFQPFQSGGGPHCGTAEKVMERFQLSENCCSEIERNC